LAPLDWTLGPFAGNAWEGNASKSKRLARESERERVCVREDCGGGEGETHILYGVPKISWVLDCFGTSGRCDGILLAP
jgi:hypothetical protein